MTVLVAVLLFASFLAAMVASARLTAEIANPQIDGPRFKAAQQAFGRPALDQAERRRYTCDDLSDDRQPTTAPSESPSPPDDVDSVEGDTEKFRYVLERACNDPATEPANVTQTWSFSGNKGNYTAKLTTQFVVPTTSWLVKLSRDGAAAHKPQQFARLLLGNVQTTTPLQFDAPQIDQAADATRVPSTATATRPAAPSLTAAPSPTSDSPTAAPQTSTRAPAALSTVNTPRVTTVTVTGTVPTVGGIPFDTYFHLNDAVQRTFRLSQRLVIKAGPARILSVRAPGATTLQAGQVITSTLTTDSEDVSVELEMPELTRIDGQRVILAGRHSSASPNFFGIDSLLESIVSALDLAAVVWALLRWRRRIEHARGDLDPNNPRAAALSQMWRRATVMVNMTTVAAAFTVATGLLISLFDWEYQYVSDWLLGGYVTLLVPGAQLATIALLAIVVPLSMRRAGRAFVQLSTPPDAQRVRLSAILPVLSALTLALGAVVALWTANIINRGLNVDWGSPDGSHDTLLQVIAVDLGGIAALTALLAWCFARMWPGSPNGRMTVSQLLTAVLGTAIVLVFGFEAGLLYQYGGSAVTTVLAVVPAASAALAILYTGELLVIGVSGQPPTWRRSVRSRQPIAVGEFAAGREPIKRRAEPAAAAQEDDEALAGAARWTASVWVYLALALLTAAVAIPGAQSPPFGGYRLTWSTAMQVSFSVRTVLTFVVIAVLVRTMWAINRAAGAIGQQTMLRAERILGGCLAVLLWAPSTAWWYLPISFAVSVIAVRYLLLPRSRLRRAEALQSIDEGIQNQALVQFADSVAMRKALDSKIAATLAGIDNNDADKVAAEVAALRSKRRRLQPAETAVGDVGPEELCFAHTAGLDRWRRARTGARDATIVALPWIILSIKADVSQILSSRYNYRVGQFLLALPLDVLWWTGIGFLFGWAYPVIRGINGLSKALVLLTTIGLPLVITDLFPGPPTRHVFVNSVQTVAEAASVLLVIGLLADYRLLRRAGFGFVKLIEARKLSAIVTWTTSVAVAIGAAVTSIIVTGVTGALTYLSTPGVQSGTEGSTSQTTGTAQP